MENYVITIARGFGSGGKEIGSKLAKRLNIPCYESQILKMASNYSGINEALFYQVDEKLKGKSKLLSALKRIPFTSVAEPSAKEFVSNINLYNIQKEIICQLAKTQSCVIIGKCADHVLKDYKNVISIYIEAPRKDCVDSIMGKLGVTEKEAHRLIEKTDKYRADYYHFYTKGKDWTNPINYDFTLNSARIGRALCVDVIEDYLKRKMSDTK